MKKTFRLMLFFLLSGFVNDIQSQVVYNGLLDSKMRLGLTFQPDGYGIQTILDSGINDYLSWGIQFGYFLGKLEREVQTNNGPVQIIIDDEDISPLERIDMHFRLDLHFNYLLKLPDRLDFVTGLHFGRNFGTHLGVDYLLTNDFGLQCNANIPLKKNVFGFDSDFNLFESTLFGAGIFFVF